MTATVNERVLELSPYTPGKAVEELERELGVADSIKLASNENPRGPSSTVRAALEGAIEAVSRYPDAAGFRLKQLLAQQLDVSADQITLGNGSNDVLELAARVAMSPGTKGIVGEHCFVVYPLAIAAAHGQMVVVPSIDWRDDLFRIAEVVDGDTRIIFLANPNNPTGTYFSELELRRLLDAVPSEVWVVIDEAYFEYVSEDDYPNGVELVREYPNVIATRTFSKAYGLASLRVGYCVSSSYFADLLNRIRQPFNVNSMALAAAEAALQDIDYLTESVQLNAAGMNYLENSLLELGYEFIPSVANFLTFDCGEDATSTYNRLLRLGVIVRPIASYEMPNHLRVTIGTHAENARFIEALASIR